LKEISALKWLVIGAFALVILSFLPLFLDTYYHKSNVDFWVWAYREVWELQHGEKA